MSPIHCLHAVGKYQFHLAETPVGDSAFKSALLHAIKTKALTDMEKI